MDLNSLSDQELEHISKGNLNALSDSTLELIAGHSEPSPIAQQPASNPDFQVANQSAPASGFSPATGMSEASIASFRGPQQDAQLPNAYRALLTNQPTQGMIEPLMRSIPATGLGIAGGAAGLVGGPLGAIGGAALGGGAGESLRQMGVNAASIYNNQPVTPTGQALGDIGVQGAVQGATEGAGQLISGAIPLAKKIITGQLRTGPNISTKIGEAVINKPSILSNALSPEEMSQEYAAFEKANNLISPRVARGANGELIFKPGQAEDLVNNVYSRLVDKTAYLGGAKAPLVPSSQELYEASQAARFLRDQARFSNPNQAANLANINEAKSLIDKALEANTAGSGMSYGDLRQANFESKAAQQFQSPYPINLNGEPNVLRSREAVLSGIGVGAATGGAVAGFPGAAIGGLAGGALGYASVSPKVAGMLINSGAKISPIAAAAAKGFRFAPGSIAAYYNSPRTEP